MNIGWIGLGAMGWPMAGHLHRDGQLTAIWNRSREKAEAFADQHPNVLLADSVGDLAASVEVIAICVSADDDLKGIIRDLRSQLKAGQIVVDHSTVSPATARQIAAELKQIDVGFIDAPVTGGVEGAIKGTLAIMAGGLWDHFHALKPVFAAYASVSHHLGPTGCGQSAKAVNQVMVAGIAEAVCESLALMETLDLPREAMLELLSGGAAGNWLLEKRGRTMLADEFDVGFAPALLLKDLKICQSLCAQTGFHSTVVNQALADYTSLVEGGESGKDISALIRLKRPTES